MYVLPARTEARICCNRACNVMSEGVQCYVTWRAMAGTGKQTQPDRIDRQDLATALHAPMLLPSGMVATQMVLTTFPPKSGTGKQTQPVRWRGCTCSEVSCETACNVQDLI